MKIRARGTPEKVENQMTPLIDVVFQLLIFFMLTLKIVEPEGDFNINMPIGAPQDNSSNTLPPVKIRLIADKSTGRLAELVFGNTRLGNDPRAFDVLNREILTMIGQPGSQMAEDLEVEIDADYELHHEYNIKAVSAVTGELNPTSGQVVRYVEKIKFAPPRRPDAADGN
ncbi:MAG: biopolymer transporter ExbD [Planctomycetaceae bacterium]